MILISFCPRFSLLAKCFRHDSSPHRVHEPANCIAVYVRTGLWCIWQKETSHLEFPCCDFRPSLAYERAQCDDAQPTTVRSMSPRLCFVSAQNGMALASNTKIASTMADTPHACAAMIVLEIFRQSDQRKAPCRRQLLPSGAQRPRHCLFPKHTQAFHTAQYSL